MKERSKKGDPDIWRYIGGKAVGAVATRIDLDWGAMQSQLEARALGDDNRPMAKDK